MLKNAKKKLLFFVLFVLLFLIIYIYFTINTTKAENGEKDDNNFIKVIQDVEDSELDNTYISDAISLSNKEVSEGIKGALAKEERRLNLAIFNDNEEDEAEETKTTVENTNINKKVLSFDYTNNSNNEEEKVKEKQGGQIELVIGTNNFTDYTKESTIYLYKSGMIDWNEVEYNANYLKKNKTISNTSTTMYVEEGEYDILISIQGYLSCVIRNVTVMAADIVNLGRKGLLAGDVNGDEVIDDLDLLLLQQNYHKEVKGEISLNIYDFNSDGFIDLLDLTELMSNFNKKKELATYVKM